MNNDRGYIPTFGGLWPELYPFITSTVPPSIDTEHTQVFMETYLPMSYWAGFMSICGRVMSWLFVDRDVSENSDTHKICIK